MTFNSAGLKAEPTEWAKIVPASGITLTATNSATDYTQTVVPGKRYMFTSDGVGTMFFSITGVITTAANIENVLPKSGVIGIEIPEGVTTLHFGADTNASHAYMAEVKSNA